MKPILNHIQSTLLTYLQAQSAFKDNIHFWLHSTALPDESLSQKWAQTHPLSFGLSYPFPLTTAENLSLPCWEKLAIEGLLFQKQSHLSIAKFLDMAESLSYTISHKNFANDRWEGRFILNPKKPWEWTQPAQGMGLKIHFITSNFNTFIA